VSLIGSRNMASAMNTMPEEALKPLLLRDPFNTLVSVMFTPRRNAHGR
jgi:hypothetical protein